ncbi:MAG: pyridoxamine 5'-phosphate oxidase family protein [Candidatus Woesearchaeota archaeon]
MDWKNNFKEGKELVLATSSKKGIPNANIVISTGFIDGKLLVANCQMKTTIQNLKKNKHICVIGGYYRIKGEVKIYSSGKYIDICTKKNNGYTVKDAILITVNGVFDLDKRKVIL